MVSEKELEDCVSKIVESRAKTGMLVKNVPSRLA